MSAKILDGKTIAAELRQQLTATIREQPTKRPPGLAVILVGLDPASIIYVRNKKVACQEVGIEFFNHELPTTTTEQQLLELIDTLNADQNVDGILVQLPLPQHFNTQEIIERIKPSKDIDGFHPYNQGRLLQGAPTHIPCTPAAVMHLLKHTQVNLTGKHAVVVGASMIVGRPLAYLLLKANCTVTICHKYTRNLANHIQQADILVSAIGKPGVIDSKNLKPEAIVIDVGINHSTEKISGDIDFDSAKEVASWITPVPGGVGPMTVTMLMQNTVSSRK